MRVMLAAFLGKKFQLAAVVLPQFDKRSGIILKRNGAVGGAVAGNQKHASLDRGQHAIGRAYRILPC